MTMMDTNLVSQQAHRTQKKRFNSILILLCVNDTDDANINVEILEGTQYDLNVNLAAATKGKRSNLRSPIMMAYFAHNDISILLIFYFWHPVYYLLDPKD